MCAAHFTCVQYVEVNESCHVKVDINLKKKKCIWEKTGRTECFGRRGGAGGIRGVGVNVKCPETTM